MKILKMVIIVIIAIFAIIHIIAIITIICIICIMQDGWNQLVLRLFISSTTRTSYPVQSFLGKLPVCTRW